MRKVSRARGRACAAGCDDGFSLVEAVIAVFLAAVIFTSAATLMMSMSITTLTARQNQQAIDLISETVEEFRKQDFAALAMVGTDLAADVTAGVVRQSGSNYFFDPDSPFTGAGAGEQVIVRNTGALNPHVREVRRNATRFSVASYVTDPADAEGANYKRLTVRVSWQTRAKVHDRQVTTFVTDTRRGLPLPRFTLAADDSLAATAGDTVVLPVSLTNRGARDRWNLTLTPSSSPGWGAVSWYEDAGSDGQLNTDPLAGPIDPLISGQTPLLETDEVYDFLAVTTNDGTLGSFALVITATSVAQPTATTASASVTKSVLVSAPVCAPCAQFTSLHFHDEPGSQPQDLLTSAAHLADTDRFGDAETGVRGLSLSAGTSASWVTPTASANINFSGTASFTLFAATQGFDRNLRGQLRVEVVRFSNGQILGDSGLLPLPGPSGSVPRWNTTEFKQVTIDVPLGNFTLAAADRLMVRVHAGPTVGMILQYDVPNTHDATAAFPAVS